MRVSGGDSRMSQSPGSPHAAPHVYEGLDSRDRLSIAARQEASASQSHGRQRARRRLHSVQCPTHRHASCGHHQRESAELAGAAAGAGAAVGSACVKVSPPVLVRGAELLEGPGQVEDLKSRHPAMRAASLLQAGVSAPSVRRHGGTRLHAGSDAAHKALPAGIRNVPRAGPADPPVMHFRRPHNWRRLAKWDHMWSD